MKQTIQEKIKDEILKRRIEADPPQVTQRQIAEKYAVSQKTISHWELALRRERGLPSTRPRIKKKLKDKIIQDIIQLRIESDPPKATQQDLAEKHKVNQRV
jgi:DNA-binding transcriptional MocR family regulator